MKQEITTLRLRTSWKEYYVALVGLLYLIAGYAVWNQVLVPNNLPPPAKHLRIVFGAN
jgi:hypothetical protein